MSPSLRFREHHVHEIQQGARFGDLVFALECVLCFKNQYFLTSDVSGQISGFCPRIFAWQLRAKTSLGKWLETAILEPPPFFLFGIATKLS
eukprot:4043804-Amphidinium_carterae.1